MLNTRAVLDLLDQQPNSIAGIAAHYNVPLREAAETVSTCLFSLDIEPIAINSFGNVIYGSILWY